MALYDPNEAPGAVETAIDFTLADVLAWARTKPAGEPYSFCDSRSCAFAQFGRETGRRALVGSSGSDILYAKGWASAFALPDNFGELVERLEALA